MNRVGEQPAAVVDPSLQAADASLFNLDVQHLRPLLVDRDAVATDRTAADRGGIEAADSRDAPARREGIPDPLSGIISSTPKAR